MRRFSKEGLRLLSAHLSAINVTVRLQPYREYKTWREFKEDYPITACYCQMGLYHWETPEEFDERMAATEWQSYHDLKRELKDKHGIPYSRADLEALDALHDRIDISRLLHQLTCDTMVIPLNDGTDGFIIKKFKNGGFNERISSVLLHLRNKILSRFTKT